MHNMHAAVQASATTPAQSADFTAFAALVAHYQRPLFAYLFHLMGDAQDAEDLTQETLLKAYAAPQHGAVHPNPGAWLYRIASNRALDELRHRQRVRWLPWNAATHDRLLCCDSEEQPERATVLHEEQCMIQAVLNQMAPRHRQVLLLREYAALSYHEIEIAMGASRAAVKSLLFRAREEFRSVSRELGYASAFHENDRDRQHALRVPPVIVRGGNVQAAAPSRYATKLPASDAVTGLYRWV